MDWVDCHFHVVERHDRYPLLAGRSYTPNEAPLASWQATLGPLGVRRGVLVQPSFYGTDNTALLNTLAQARGALVGVGADDPGRLAFFVAFDARATALDPDIVTFPVQLAILEDCVFRVAGILSFDAVDDTIAILKEEGETGGVGCAGGVFHCFTESQAVARAALDLGFYISLSGILTFKTAADLRLPPHLADYAAQCRAFRWEDARAALQGLPGGGLNIAFHGACPHDPDRPRRPDPKNS